MADVNFSQPLFIIPKNIGRFPISITKTGDDIASVDIKFVAKTLRTFKGGNHAINDEFYGDFFAKNTTITWNGSEEGEKVILIEIFGDFDKPDSFFSVELIPNGDEQIESDVCRCHIINSIDTFLKNNVLDSGSEPISFESISSKRFVPMVLDNDLNDIGLILDVNPTVNSIETTFISSSILHMTGECNLEIITPSTEVKNKFKLTDYIIGIKLPFTCKSENKTPVNILSDMNLKGYIKPNSNLLILETPDVYFGANFDDSTVHLKMVFNVVAKYT